MAKIEGNGARDRATDEALRDAGWLPIRVWEHESTEDAATMVRQIIQSRSG